MFRTFLALCMAIAFAGSIGNGFAMAEEPTQTLQSLLAEARDAQSRRDFRAAAESYRKATQLDPSVPELWANLGLMYHESGNSAEAIRSFKEAARLNGSLFVPQLFLGIEYLQSKNPEAAIPYLENAERLNPQDVQATLNLAKAYDKLGRADRAAEAYRKMTHLTPNDGDAWLSLGMAYLQQVENDARAMTTTYGHSRYVELRGAETLTEEGKLVQAEDAYKTALASAAPAPCAHAEYGVALLRKKEVAEAQEQFELETRSQSHCGLAALGLAATQLAEGHPDAALPKLIALGKADAGFLASNLPLFRGAVSSEQVGALVDLSRAQENDNPAAGQIGQVVAKAFDADAAPADFSSAAADAAPRATATAGELYASGQFGQCREALAPKLDDLGAVSLRLLAACSFDTGDYEMAAKAAERLKANLPSRAEGLYWESKADEKLSVAALLRAGEIDADSPRMHLLLGNVFRQKRRWSDAEAEYRRAVALDPKSHAARLSLGIALFTQLKNDEALEIDRGLLAEDERDPEANLLAAEILVQLNRFSEVEPYLARCANVKPEFVPGLHVLRAQVYAETGRVPEAISEYKLGLATDEDGSIHYRLARLYQKSGDKEAAQAAFQESKRIGRAWDDRARVALEQMPTDTSRQ